MTNKLTGAGPGRPPLSDDVRPVTLKLSPRHIAIFKTLGDGQVNRGIRKAADLLSISIHQKK